MRKSNRACKVTMNSVAVHSNHVSKNGGLYGLGKFFVLWCFY